jgi:perosamine synthetase
MTSPERIALSPPDYGALEQKLVTGALCHPDGSEYAEAFETEFAEMTGQHYALAVCNGTVALWLALQTARQAQRDQVILSPNSWLAIGQVVQQAGLHPLLADIDAESGCLDPRAAAALISNRTCAILVANSNGHPANWRAFQTLAHESGIRLIEDSSEAIASRYHGQAVGGFTGLAVFDLSSPGPLSCGEGGMLVTSNPDLAQQLYQLRQRRHRSPADATPPLQWARMPEVSAALGLAQIERLGEMLAERKRVEHSYRHWLSSIPRLGLPQPGAEVDEVHWMRYQIQLPPAVRPMVIDALELAAIECRPVQAHGLQRKPQLPHWRRMRERGIALPFHSRLDEAAIERIVHCLESVLAALPA